MASQMRRSRRWSTHPSDPAGGLTCRRRRRITSMRGATHPTEIAVNDILLGKGEQQVQLLARYANRHGLVAGATGSGKTVSLMVLAEGLSRLGVPIFIADVKGDVAGLAMPGTPSDKVQQRVGQIGIEGFTYEASPVVF